MITEAISIRPEMVVLHNLPMPPSANEMYDHTIVKRKAKDGFGVRVGASRKKAPILAVFQLDCLSYRNTHHLALAKARAQMLGWIMQGNTLRVDTLFVFHVERVWTVNRKPEQIDADNRRKAGQDGVAKIIGLDDKWFFAGEIEKATCSRKESECSIIVIRPHRPRTLEQIRHQIANTLAF